MAHSLRNDSGPLACWGGGGRPPADLSRLRRDDGPCGAQRIGTARGGLDLPRVRGDGGAGRQLNLDRRLRREPGEGIAVETFDLVGKAERALRIVERGRTL